MRNDFQSDYLMHHGILGQKWGHKNGPPYPIDAKDHSASEKKAGWKESLKTKRDQKKFAKEIKKATKKSYTTDEAQKAMGEIVRSKLTSEQKQNLVAKKEKMESDQSKDQKAYSKEFDKEYNKRFKDRKPTEHELEDLYDEISNRMINSKTSEQAMKSWDEYIKYSREITNDLIGKYGDTKLSNIGAARYNHMINRVLDDLGNEKEYKQVFSDWNNAESKWYWNREGSKRSESLNKKQQELGQKEAAYEEKLKSKGYSDKEIKKLREESLKENSSYHKYEELNIKIRDTEDKISDIKSQMANTGWKPSGKGQVTYRGKSKKGSEIDLAYDDYINLNDDLKEQQAELKKLKKEYNK